MVTTLLDRLLGEEDETEGKLSALAFISGLREYRSRAITRVQFEDTMGLTTAERSQLDIWITRMDGDLISFDKLYDVLILGRDRDESGNHYYPRAKVASELGV